MRILVLFASFAFAFTLWALEWNGVAEIHTTDSQGVERTTRVWYVAQSDGAILLEAAGPASPWLADVRANPSVRFASDEISGAYRASVRDNPDAHREIRRRLRAKYGVRDLWIGCLVDTSASSLVILETSGGAALRPARTTPDASS